MTDTSKHRRADGANIFVHGACILGLPGSVSHPVLAKCCTSVGVAVNRATTSRYTATASGTQHSTSFAALTIQGTRRERGATLACKSLIALPPLFEPIAPLEAGTTGADSKSAPH